jgi:hypothetical protein
MRFRSQREIECSWHMINEVDVMVNTWSNGQLVVGIIEIDTISLFQNRSFDPAIFMLLVEISFEKVAR